MDKVIINPRERPYSPDIDNLQKLASRALSDVQKFMHAESFNPDSSVVANNICYGLAVSSDAGADLPTSYVTVRPGILMHDSSTLSPTPGTLDSSYRIGFNRNSLQVAKPTVVAVTWYLLEAQVAETTTSYEVRDIMNPVTGLFAAENVAKIKECGITTQWVEGSSTQIANPSGGDWVVLGAFLMQIGGAILLSSDAVDLRPTGRARTAETRQGWSRTPSVPVLCTVSTIASPASFLVRLAVDHAVSNQDASTEVGGGIRLSVGDGSASLNSMDPTSAAIIEPATATVASTWYYLYLCPWFDVGPDSGRQGVSHTRGVLVLSVNPPDPEGLFNATAVALPAPFGAYTVPAYQAPCVGALMTNVANSGWVPMAGGNGEYIMPLSPTPAVVSGGTTNPLPIPSNVYPAHARTLTWVVTITSVGASASQVAAEIGDASAPGTGIATNYVYVSATDPLNINPMQLKVPRKNSAQLRTALSVRTLGDHALTLIGYTT